MALKKAMENGLNVWTPATSVEDPDETYSLGLVQPPVYSSQRNELESGKSDLFARLLSSTPSVTLPNKRREKSKIITFLELYLQNTLSNF